MPRRQQPKANKEVLWITVQEAWQWVNKAVSLGTIYRIAHSGKVRTTRVLGRILIDSDDFDRLLTEAEWKMIAALPGPERRAV